MKKFFEIGGFIAGAILIVFGVAVIALGASGRSTVNSSLKQQQIVGTPDMTPSGIKAEAQKAGLTNISFPSCSIANVAVTSGSPGSLLRPVHADSCARGLGRSLLLADAALREC